MKKFISLSGILILFILVLANLSFLSCNGKDISPDYRQVSAITGGTIGINEVAVVEFVNPHDTSKPLSKKAFVLSPSVKGTVSWRDEYSLIFTPSNSYKPGQKYKARINVEGVSPFSFSFTAALPLFEVEFDSVQLGEDDDILIAGFVRVDDDADVSKIEQVITSREIGKPSWIHEDGQHRFFFDAVTRGQSSRTVEVSWDGSPIGIKKTGYNYFEIPGIDVFQMLDLNFVDNIIQVSFSSYLDENMDLRGFISLAGETDVQYKIEGNTVKIYGSNSGGLASGAQLVIQDLVDSNGKRLSVPVQYTVPDRWELPEVRFTGTGVILPTSQGAQLVIETRNVSGILVEAFQIHNNNMFQFLQVNSFKGESQLDRVGEPMWTKAFNFNWSVSDQNKWVRRGLDMAELSKKFPGGMFHIRISFRHRHIQYACTKDHENFADMEFANDKFPSFAPASSSESSNWDYYDDDDYYGYGGNNRGWYSNRMDPCHPAYYVKMGSHDITKGRNVLVSDLGILAKRSYDGSWLVSTTNLITARPAPNTEFKIFNYQGRQVSQGRTDANGVARVPASSETGNGSRLFVYAESSLGRAYLKINDSLALAVSHFDVFGSAPSSGIRGLIYGERDVWRPGDEIFLTFLLADPQSTLPANHPVIFELDDPRGRPVMSRTYTSSVDGFYAINASTASDAPTGDWTARVKVGGSTFSRNVKIETIMPNRLKVGLDFNNAELIKSGSQKIPIESEWLYGAPASGLKADVSVTFSDRETTFASYSDFIFRDPSRSVTSERQKVWDGNLDKDGKSTFQMNLNPGNAVPGKVTARFMSRVFEPSGVFSSEQVSMEYSPYSRYVGIKLPKGDATRNMLLTDTDHNAEIVLLDEDGKPVQTSIALDCAIYKLNWRWWWERGDSESAEFASSLSRSPISRQTVNTTNGKANFKFRVNYPDWGRYLVIAKDNAGHAAAQIVYIDWPGWAGRAQEGGQGSQSTLVLTPLKPSYNTGEKVQITFPSNKDAAALVVVEKGGNVLATEWLTCQDGTTRFEFNAEASMVPNIYVHITMVQPHLQTQNDLPLRLYGVTPVMIQEPRIVLNPQIKTQENWQAESRVSFTVSESGGRPMAYTVAVVDEGLLGLTRFNLPNPRNTFYARDASFLKSWDLFQDIMGAYSGRLETLLAIGGSDADELDSAKETQRFKPVVRFFGPFQLGRGESKTETFDLPPYIGAVRVMVLAASSTNESATGKTLRAYGTAQQSVKVTSDLMVFASLPRVLSPNDEFEVPVYVNALAAGKRSVKVNLTAQGATVQGQASQNVEFDKNGEKLVRFKVKAPANPGQVKFTVAAESPGLKTAKQVVDMEVRSTAIPVTKTTQNLIAAGDTWKGSLVYPGKDGTNTLIASFSKLPPLNLESRLEYLVAYPHGCAEQTTSGAFPQLYLDKVMQLNDTRKAEIRTNINAGIERLLGMQQSSGGFSYWPGESSPHDWASSYVGHFLLEARRAGYNVNDSAIKKWITYQKSISLQWNANDQKFTEQAYRLYTLALSGDADLGSMNRLRSHKLPFQASWRLAAAYWHAGQRDTARNMIKGLAMPQGEYRQLSETFGSTLRDKAMILETLILLSSAPGSAQEDIVRTRNLFDDVTKALAEDKWLSTQETAYALIAVVPYIQSNAASGNLTLEYTAAGKSGSIDFATPAAQNDFGKVTGTSTNFTVTNRSSVPVYVRYTAKGLPEEGKEPALSEGLSLTVEYRDANNKVIAPENLKLGDDMEISVRVRNTYQQNVDEIALIVPIPASWEIVNTRLGGSSSSSSYRYQDIRDDRVMTYFNLGRNDEKTIKFKVNKAYEGSFFRPAIHAYAMYDESIRALIPGAR